MFRNINSAKFLILEPWVYQDMHKVSSIFYQTENLPNKLSQKRFLHDPLFVLFSWLHQQHTPMQIPISVYHWMLVAGNIKFDEATQDYMELFLQRRHNVCHFQPPKLTLMKGLLDEYLARLQVCSIQFHQQGRILNII